MNHRERRAAVVIRFFCGQIRYVFLRSGLSNGPRAPVAARVEFRETRRSHGRENDRTRNGFGSLTGTQNYDFLCILVGRGAESAFRAVGIPVESRRGWSVAARRPWAAALHRSRRW